MKMSPVSIEDTPSLTEAEEIRTHTVQAKRKIIRNRRINSCKRCYGYKRKCDKNRSGCERCRKAKVPCEYYTMDGIKGKNTSTTLEDHGNSSEDKTSSDENHTKALLSSTLNTEINPQLRSTENQNFTLIISATGEYSKFFPTCVFPYYEHQANLTLLTSYNDATEKSTAIFNFSQIIHPFNSMDDIRSKVPSHDISDFLVDHFFNYVFPFVPIVDKSEFLYEYKKYWKHPLKFKDKNFFFVLFSIYFTSSTNLFLLKELESMRHFQRSSHDNLFFDLDFGVLRNTCFQCIENLKHFLNSDSSPSISLIIGLTLIYYVGSSNGFATPIQVANLVKYSQIFGLHRSIINGSDSLPMRDIIYSFVWYLDGLSAYYSGFPPNMFSEFFQCEHSSLLQSDDINIIFLYGRLQNMKVWNKVLSEFNKINKTDKDCIEDIEEMYLNSIAIVNLINQKILNCDYRNLNYRKWLVTETRLGLRKSSLMFSALRCSLSYKHFNNSNVDNITSELVLQSMLLVNESILKLKLGEEVMKEAFWFYRYAIPFQAMYIVLSHIQKFPDISLNFSMLYDELEYTTSELLDINYTNGDLRMKLIDKSIETLRYLVKFWHPAHADRFERIIKFREFIREKDETLHTEERQGSQAPSIINMQNYLNKFNSVLQTAASTSEYTPSTSDETSPRHVESKVSEKDMNNAINFLDYPGLFDDTYEAYAFLDEGSKFWFGDI